MSWIFFFFFLIIIIHISTLIYEMLYSLLHLKYTTKAKFTSIGLTKSRNFTGQSLKDSVRLVFFFWDCCDQKYLILWQAFWKVVVEVEMFWLARCFVLQDNCGSRWKLLEVLILLMNSFIFRWGRRWWLLHIIIILITTIILYLIDCTG